MARIGSSLGVSLPAEGDVGWGDTLNGIITTLLSALEGYVPGSSYAASATLDFAGYGARNTGSVRATAQVGTLTSPGDEHKIYTYNSELYFTDADGNAVKITDAGAVNDPGAASVVDTSGGGGAGAYGDPRVIRYGSASYQFKDGSGASDFAPLKLADLLLNSTSTGYFTRFVNGGLSGTLTFPSTLPTTPTLVQMGSTGSVTYSNTVANTATFSGVVTGNSTFTCTNLTFSAERDHTIHPVRPPARLSGGGLVELSTTTFTQSTAYGRLSLSGVDTGSAYYTLCAAGTLKSVVFYYTTTVTGTPTFDMNLYVYQYGTSGTLLGSATSSSYGTNVALSVTGLSAAAGDVLIRLTGSTSPTFGESIVVYIGGSTCTMPKATFVWS